MPPMLVDAQPVRLRTWVRFPPPPSKRFRAHLRRCSIERRPDRATLVRSRAERAARAPGRARRARSRPCRAASCRSASGRAAAAARRRRGRSRAGSGWRSRGEADEARVADAGPLADTLDHPPERLVARPPGVVYVIKPATNQATGPATSNSVCLGSCRLPSPGGSIDGLRAFSRNPGRRARP